MEHSDCSQELLSYPHWPLLLSVHSWLAKSFSLHTNGRSAAAVAVDDDAADADVDELLLPTTPPEVSLCWSTREVHSPCPGRMDSPGD